MFEVQNFGKEEQFDQLMKPFLGGDKVGCFALSEPGKLLYIITITIKSLALLSCYTHLFLNCQLFGLHSFMACCTLLMFR
jgi:hypothetical protein